MRVDTYRGPWAPTGDRVARLSMKPSGYIRQDGYCAPSCMGELLALREMQVHLIMVASRVRLRYIKGEPPELEAGVNLRAKNDLIMLPMVARCSSSNSLQVSAPG
jgi:hypothetical protein